MPRNKHKPDGLKSKVFKTDFEIDEKGKFFYFCNALKNLSIKKNNKIYVPFCEHRKHQSLIDDLQVCYSRGCLQKRDIKPTRDSGCNSLYKVYIKKSNPSS